MADGCRRGIALIINFENELMKSYLPKLTQFFENIEGDSLDNISLHEYDTDPFKGKHGYVLSGTIIFIMIFSILN